MFEVDLFPFLRCWMNILCKFYQVKHVFPIDRSDFLFVRVTSMLRSTYSVVSKFEKFSVWCFFMHITTTTTKAYPASCGKLWMFAYWAPLKVMLTMKFPWIVDVKVPNHVFWGFFAFWHGSREICCILSYMVKCLKYLFFFHLSLNGVTWTFRCNQYFA